MLTLHGGNRDQVIPLGERLRGLTSRLVFNRLSQVGEATGMAVVHGHGGKVFEDRDPQCFVE